MDDVENEQLNVLEIVVSHQMDEHIEVDTLCRTNADPSIIERPIVRHVAGDFIDDGMNNCHIKTEQATINDREKPCTHIFI